MRPRILRIHGCREPPKQLLAALEVGALGRGREWEAFLGPQHAVDEVVRRRAGDGGVGRVEREPELVHKPEIRRVRLPDHLAAELNGSPVVDGNLLDSAADTFARLEHQNVRAALHEVARGGQPSQACSDNDNVGHVVTASSSARMRRASAGRCAVTAEPTSYSSTSPEFATSA